MLKSPSSHLHVFPFALQAAAHAADLVQEVIYRRAAQGRLALIAFDLPESDDAAGSMNLLLGVLARRVQLGTLSLANVAALPVWDWWPTPAYGAGQTARLRHFLQSNTDICGANIWSLEGGTRDTLPGLCSTIENRIAELGGIDAVLLSARPDCQFGQNELDGWKDSRTRLVFAMQSDQPRRAITLGLANLREAEKVILLGTGGASADSVYWHAHDTFNEVATKATIIADRAAATRLDHIGFPWRVGPLADAGLMWNDLTIAHAGIAEAGCEDLSFDNCFELLGTFAGVDPDQDPRPALRDIAHRAIRSAISPVGWKSLLVVSRHAQDAATEIPGIVQALAQQKVVLHTVCLTGASAESQLHTRCAADTFDAWTQSVSAAITRHKPDHIITLDNVSGVLSQVALEASTGKPIQVLCARDVKPWQFQWIWPGVTQPEINAFQPDIDTKRAHVRAIVGTDYDIEILGLVR